MKVNCLNCGKPIKICKAHYLRGQGKFCSKKCFIETKRKKTYTTIVCKTCGASFQIPQSKAKGTRGKFCSRKCFHAWHKTLKGVKNKLFKRIEKTCIVCNKQYKAKQYLSVKSKYCSDKCKRSVVEKIYGGKKQYFRYHRQRRKALMRKAGSLDIKTIQLVYENNIKKYGTLTCIYCLKPIEFGQDTLEHKQPLIKEGTNEYNNLGVACKHCNCSKRHKTETEYRRLIWKSKK
jgi:5-methylcytosine-specific restriction endonuclease McrA